MMVPVRTITGIGMRMSARVITMVITSSRRRDSQSALVTGVAVIGMTPSTPASALTAGPRLAANHREARR